jgi:hypothetical protein
LLKKECTFLPRNGISIFSDSVNCPTKETTMKNSIIAAVAAALSLFVSSCSGEVDIIHNVPDSQTIDDTTTTNDGTTPTDVFVYPGYITNATLALKTAFYTVPDYTLADGTVCSTAIDAQALQCEVGSACASTANCGIAVAYLSLLLSPSQSLTERCVHIKEYKKNLELIPTMDPIAHATEENVQRVADTHVQLRIASVNIDTFISVYCN